MISRKDLLKLVFGLVLFVALPGHAVEIGEAITQLMRETYDLTPAEYEIEVISNRLRTAQVEPGNLTFTPLSRKEPIGLYSIRVEIENDRGLIEKGQVRLRISRFADVLVAADKIQRHETLCEQQFELKRSDVTSLREQPVESTAEIEGQRSKRNLRMGSILTTNAMEPVPDIEVGGEVTIVFSDDWGTITAPGKALQAGWRGGKVRVRNLASGKIIYAQVISSKSVEVNP